MYKSTLIRKCYFEGINIGVIVLQAGTTRKYVLQIISDLKGGGGNTRRIRHDQYRYRKRNPKLRNIWRKRNYSKGARDTLRKYTSWSKEDEKLILIFSGTDRQLAGKIGRSVEAIQIKRHLLKRAMRKKLESLLPPEQITTIQN